VPGYRAIRRKAASLINGILIASVGAKIVPARSKTFAVRRLGTAGGCTRMQVSAGNRSLDVTLRERTSDWMTFDQIFLDEDYDLRPLARYGELTEIYSGLVAGGRPVILDLGANIGLSACYFHLLWPEARIIAVEPDPDNARLLRENVAGFDAIVVEGAAAGKSGRTRIVDSQVEKNAVRVTAVDCDGLGDVEAVSVPDLLQRHGHGGAPFIAKIDIEGGERDLFSGDSAWVDDFPLLVVELHDWLYPGEGTARPFLKAMAERDRDFVYLDENVFSIRNS
jgi:FkbM family methyltransferase